MESESIVPPYSAASFLMEESERRSVREALLESRLRTWFHLDSAWFMLASSESFSAGSSSSITVRTPILTSLESLFPHWFISYLSRARLYSMLFLTACRSKTLVLLPPEPNSRPDWLGLE